MPNNGQQFSALYNLAGILAYVQILLEFLVIMVLTVLTTTKERYFVSASSGEQLSKYAAS